MQRLTDAEMQAAGANPTAEEYRTIMKQIIPTFNHINNTDVAQLADADLPYAGDRSKYRFSKLSTANK